MRLKDLKNLSREQLHAIMDNEYIHVALKCHRFEKAMVDGTKKESGLDIIKGLLYVVDEDCSIFGTIDIVPLDEKYFKKLSTKYIVDIEGLNPMDKKDEEGLHKVEVEDKNFRTGLEFFQEVFEYDYPIDMKEVLLDIIYGAEVING